MRERVMMCIISCLLDSWTLPLYPPIPGFCLSVCLFVCFFFFFGVATFFVCLVLIEYVVCSVLTEHAEHFDPHIGCSQRDSAL